MKIVIKKTTVKFLGNNVQHLCLNFFLPSHSHICMLQNFYQESFCCLLRQMINKRLQPQVWENMSKCQSRKKHSWLQQTFELQVRSTRGTTGINTDMRALQDFDQLFSTIPLLLFATLQNLTPVLPWCKLQKYVIIVWGIWKFLFLWSFETKSPKS